jgi:hypothetical protein
VARMLTASAGLVDGASTSSSFFFFSDGYLNKVKK